MKALIDAAVICDRCKAEVIWATHTGTRKPTLLDATPDPTQGNCILDKHSMTYFVIRGPDLIERAITNGDDLYVNHLSHCKPLEQWPHDLRAVPARH